MARDNRGRPFPGPEAVHLDGQRTRLTRVSFANAHVHTLNALTLYRLALNLRFASFNFGAPSPSP